MAKPVWCNVDVRVVLYTNSIKVPTAAIRFYGTEVEDYMRKRILLVVSFLIIFLLSTSVVIASSASGNAGNISTSAYLNILPRSGSAETIASSVPYSIYVHVEAYNSSGSLIASGTSDYTNYNSIGQQVGSYTHADAYCSCPANDSATSGYSHHSVASVGINPETGGPCSGPSWSTSLYD